VYSKKRTLQDYFTLTSRKIDLPRDAVLDGVYLRGVVTLNNGAASEFTGLKSDILKAIKEIRIVSDGNNVHYSLNGLDAAIMNYYDTKGVAENPDEVITVGASSSKEFNFTLLLDEGDIIAVTKDSLEMSVSCETEITSDVTISAFTGKVTVNENIFTPGEFVETYGQNMEMVAEPKVTIFEKSFDASEELRESLDLPTGTLLRRAFFVAKDDSGTRAGVSPGKLGIVATTPDRRELYSVDWETFRDHNRFNQEVSAPIDGVALIDYGAEITSDIFGLRGWKYNKGDYQAAVKSASSGKVRYISCEYVVNTAAFEQVLAVPERT
jgi:hypothetical protein